jgi:hypothetical protein
LTDFTRVLSLQIEMFFHSFGHSDTVGWRATRLPGFGGIADNRGMGTPVRDSSDGSPGFCDRPSTPIAVDVARAIAWCVGLIGLLVVPAWLCYVVLISEASFFGEAPSSTSLERADEARMWGRAVATSALVGVTGTAAWSFRRGVRAWGLLALAAIGAVTTAFVWAM